MLPRFLTLFLAMLCLCASAAAQSTEVGVTDRLNGRELYFRGQWMDDRLKFDDAGKPGTAYNAGSFAEAGFELRRARLAGRHLRLEGVRVVTVFSPDGRPHRRIRAASFQAGADPERVLVEIEGQKSGQDFGPALDAIFADGLPDLTPSLPETWQPYARKYWLKSAAENSASVPAGACECDDKREKDGIRAAKILHSEEPEFNESARMMHINGTTEIQFTVGLDGKPEQLAVHKPLGGGLDEMALASVANYRYRPASQEGRPVKVSLVMEVSFQTFTNP